MAQSDRRFDRVHHIQWEARRCSLFEICKNPEPSCVWRASCQLRAVWTNSKVVPPVLGPPLTKPFQHERPRLSSTSVALLYKLMLVLTQFVSLVREMPAAQRTRQFPFVEIHLWCVSLASSSPAEDEDVAFDICLILCGTSVDRP